MPSAPRPALVLAGLALGLALDGCSHPRPAPPPPPPAAGVEFQLYLDPAVLPPGHEVVVTARDPAGGCTKYDHLLDQRSAAPCPQMPDRRESFVLVAPAAGAPLVVRTTLFAVGTAYELSIAGLAADGCNRAHGESRGTVAASPVIVRTLPLATTRMACPS